VVPWLVLLGVLGLRARLDAQRPGRAELATGAVLLALGVFLNGLGALAPNTWLWNAQLSLHGQGRLWDWRRAQFLAAFVWPMPGDGANVAAGAKIAIGSIHAEPYLKEGWGPPQAGMRWTEGPRARIVFNLDGDRLTHFRMRLQPFLVPGKLDRQRVNFVLNGQRFDRLTLRKPTSAIHQIPVPAELLQEHNVLELRLPDAASPESLGVGNQAAALGVGLWWLELQ
jgi:hypothetical protein